MSERLDPRHRPRGWGHPPAAGGLSGREREILDQRVRHATGPMLVEPADLRALLEESHWVDRYIEREAKGLVTMVSDPTGPALLREAYVKADCIGTTWTDSTEALRWAQDFRKRVEAYFKLPATPPLPKPRR